MKYLSILFLSSGLILAQDQLLYSNDQYRLYSNRVQQGDWIAKAMTNNHIQSSYQNQSSLYQSRKITLKFSINSKDNELPSGQDHELYIGKETESPLFKFGQRYVDKEQLENDYLPQNYKYTFRVDFRHVLQDFSTKGYHELYNGERLYKKDFKGLYIAGSQQPLSWDFPNLHNKDLELKDDNGDGIYEITLTLNPYQKPEQSYADWKLTKDLSQLPQFSSNLPLMDALFKMASSESIQNVEPDGTLRTGLEWSGVWTRDVSYSIYLAFASQQTEAAIKSLKQKVKNDRIIQDTGSGGAWPVSSDRFTWAIAAWELYLYNGDQEWLDYAYEVIKNSILDDEKVVFDAQLGLYRGESSFLDWREQTYPKWMDNKDIYASYNLGTNAVFYQTLVILSKMGAMKKDPMAAQFKVKAEHLKTSINTHFWVKEKGYYGQYLYGRLYPILSKRAETLGESLAILFDIADEKQKKSIIENTPITPFGTPNVFPQTPGIPPYHNDAIWPFVQGFFNLAAAKSGNEYVVNHGISSIYRPAALFLTNYENMVATTGDYNGTAINSSSMLWSMAGNLATVYKIFMGIQFEEDGIHFKPSVPKSYKGVKELKQFKYRDAVLDIKVSGYGTNIKSFKLNGKVVKDHKFPANYKGNHKIEIVLDHKEYMSQYNFRAVEYTLDYPKVERKGNALHWNSIDGASVYKIYKNGVFFNEIKDLKFDLKDEVGEFAVSSKNNEFESFISEPIDVSNDVSYVYQLEESHWFENKIEGFEGQGYIPISVNKNREIEVPINIEKEGVYALELRYANGTGPWNTDNNCAVRSLWVNQQYQGAIVMPQRGLNEWSDWGKSNILKIVLKKGENRIKIQYDIWNQNMDGLINDALLDAMILKRISE